MKIFLIDLDDTLIDTSNFKEGMFNVLSKATGLSFSVLKRLYNSLRVKGQLEERWLPDFVQLVSKNSSLSQKTVSDFIFGLVKTMKVKKKVFTFVSSIKGNKCLLTSGHIKFQKEKVKNFNLQKYFDCVIYVSGQKDRYIVDHIEGETLRIHGQLYDDVEIIDDKVSLLGSLKKYPFIKITHPDRVR
jgi:FMN phosphatase YigB (HAD superfamily)